GYVRREERCAAEGGRPRHPPCQALMMAAKGGSLMTRRIGSFSRRSWSLSAVSLAAAALAAAQLFAAPSASLAAAHTHVGYGHPSVGNLECNGPGPIQRAPKPDGIICAEVHFAPGGPRFKDNGYYVGHDEPLVQFYSNRPGSSTHVSYVQTLPRDPSALP